MTVRDTGRGGYTREATSPSPGAVFRFQRNREQEGRGVRIFRELSSGTNPR